MAAMELGFPVVYVEAVEYRVDFARMAEVRVQDGDIVHVWLQGEVYAS